MLSSGLDIPANRIAEFDDYDPALIRQPGTVQAHGVLLVVDAETHQILQVSANAAELFQQPLDALLGESLTALLPSAAGAHLHDCLAVEPDAEQKVWEFSLPALPPTEQFNRLERHRYFSAVIHRQDRCLLIEVEPKLANEQQQFIGRLRAINDTLTCLRNANSLPQLIERVAREIRKLTQFDRVMIYQFEPDRSGAVIAEDKQPHLNSYFDLHFPAADIPTVARELFYHNWTRSIADVGAAAVPLVPECNPHTHAPLDMRAVGLRMPFSCHLEYLTNMGVRASLVIPLIVERRLWGLISCHHYKPRYLDYETRKACEFVGQFISVELVHQEEQTAFQQRNRVKAIQAELRRALTRDPEYIATVLQHRQNDLLSLVEASGAAVFLDGQLSLLGETPSEAQTRALIDWLGEQTEQEVLVTHHLSRQYPPAREFQAIASGLLAVSIFLNQTSYHILWFRPEFARLVSWAGNPHEAVAIAEQNGIRRLSPRGSFACWQEIVREQSRTWSPTTLEAAHELRNTLLLAVLEFSQSALQAAAERATLANRAKSQFLAKMSHELRTPLNAILGFAQMIGRDETLASGHRENIDIITRSGEHLLLLINDVLEMSRIEAGQMQLQEADFDLHQTLDTLADMFAGRASEQGLAWRIERSPELPRAVRGDERKLRQILINLIGNALKFTESGWVVLRVGASEAAAGYTFHFAVEDTGCGIARDQLATIFDAFVQSEPNRQLHQGTGLGLAISQQFAHLLGGNLSVQSQVGRGTTFSGSVQLSAAQQPIAAPQRHAENWYLAAGQPEYRILVVEDRPDAQLLVKHLLIDVGFQVEVAAHGQEAVAIWETWQPQAVLMDIRMPVMDGYEATRRIRQREINRQDAEGASDRQPAATKIIALTADAFTTDQQAVLRAGCDDFIAKPFQQAELLDKLGQHLGVCYEQRQLRSDESLTSMPRPHRALQAEDLQALPKAWRDRVLQAAMAIDETALRQLTDELPEEHAKLQQGLHQLLDNFRIDVILELLDPECDLLDLARSHRDP